MTITLEAVDAGLKEFEALLERDAQPAEARYMELMGKRYRSDEETAEFAYLMTYLEDKE